MIFFQYLIWRVFYLFVFGALFFCQTNAQSGIPIKSRKDVAVFFPVEHFSAGWDSLPHAIQECHSIANVLQKEYGFETQTQSNFSKAQIKAKLFELALANYGDKDQLLLYFSMHNYLDENGQGYLIPNGAVSTGVAALRTWISHSDLCKWVKQIPCKHIFMVLDAGYSPLLSGLSKTRPSENVNCRNSDCQTQINCYLNDSTRFYLVSGHKDRTSAFSDLARHFLKALKNSSKMVKSLNEVLAVIGNAYPTPKWGDFAGENAGSFVFVSKAICLESQAPPLDLDNAACLSAERQYTLEAWTYYLERFPNGSCQDQALDAISWFTALKKNDKAAYEEYLKKHPYGLHNQEGKNKLYLIKALTTPPKMIFIKGGRFKMGVDDFDFLENVRPEHEVNVNDFYISESTISVAEFKTFVEKTGYVTDAEKAGYSSFYNEYFFNTLEKCNWRHEGQGQPVPDSLLRTAVVHVSWNDAVAYCKWLSNWTGNNYRLPTEAEWEYTAKIGHLNTNCTWRCFDKNSIGNFPNKIGLYDLCDYIGEWCSDWYEKDYYKNSALDNPLGPKNGTRKVVRGHLAPDVDPYKALILRNYSIEPNFSANHIGIRIVLSK